MRRIILGSLKNDSERTKQIRKAYRKAHAKIIREFDLSKFDYDVVFASWRDSGEYGFWWYIDFGYIRLNIGVDKILFQDALYEGICEGFSHNFVADSTDFNNGFSKKIIRNAYTADFLGWKYEEKYSLDNLSEDNLLKIKDALNGKVDEDWLWSRYNGWHFYGFSKKYFESLGISRKDILKLKENEFNMELISKIEKLLEDYRKSKFE